MLFASSTATLKNLFPVPPRHFSVNSAINSIMASIKDTFQISLTGKKVKPTLASMVNYSTPAINSRSVRLCNKSEQ